MKTQDMIAAEITEAIRDYMDLIDCRTCLHCRDMMCLSVAMCIGGKEYRPSRPIHLWPQVLES